MVKRICKSKHLPRGKSRPFLGRTLFFLRLYVSKLFSFVGLIDPFSNPYFTSTIVACETRAASFGSFSMTKIVEEVEDIKLGVVSEQTCESPGVCDDDDNASSADPAEVPTVPSGGRTRPEVDFSRPLMETTMEPTDSLTTSHTFYRKGRPLRLTPFNAPARPTLRNTN